MWWKILGVLAGAVAVGLVAYGTVKIYKKITAEAIKEQIRQLGNNDAFKAMIKSKTTKKVNVGIFDSQDEEIGEQTIESEKGVASNLRVGQSIYL